MPTRLRRGRIPVILDGVTGAPGNDEPYDLVYANPGVLQKAGVQIAWATGGASSARDMPYEVGLAEAYGFDPEEALKSITINPARMFGVDKEYGSIEVGKVANVIVTTGDPIDIRSQIKEVFVKGRRMQFDDRHTKFYEQYRARPKPPRANRKQEAGSRDDAGVRARSRDAFFSRINSARRAQSSPAPASCFLTSC